MRLITYIDTEKIALPMNCEQNINSHFVWEFYLKKDDRKNIISKRSL